MMRTDRVLDPGEPSSLCQGNLSSRSVPIVEVHNLPVRRRERDHDDQGLAACGPGTVRRVTRYAYRLPWAEVYAWIF